ncbi:MAG: serine/threonine protein kinase [Pirellula sp.]|nr:serine/threonine protein kinase [Pirellula sp.]
MMNSQAENPDENVDSARHPVEVLADEFAERIRRGESPSIDQYVSQYPEWASVIRQVFEPIAIVEKISAQRQPVAGKQRQAVPSQLGDFRIIREIGRGGMGVVYESVQISLQRRVALKVINVQSSDQDKLQSRFRREAEAAAGLHHTNIVQVYGSGVDGGVHYYAMQLIQGAPLNEVIDWLRRESHLTRNNDQSVVSCAGKKLLATAFLAGEMTGTGADSLQTEKNDRSKTTFVDSTNDSNVEAEWTSRTLYTEVVDSFPSAYYRNAARIIADIANALGYAHRQRILHRDIKPANLILDRSGCIWVTDFGLARRIDVDGATQAGEVLGTIRYMAPEQITGGGDARMDIYSLGLCLYELVTLQSPFDAPKQRLLDPMRFSVLPPPRKMNPNIPPDLETIILKACTAESEARYANATEFEADLRRFLEDRPILAKKASSWEHLRRWAKRNPALASLSSLTAAMLVLLIAVLAVWNRQQQDSLAETKHLYKEAEKNLVEKTSALEKERQANLRAEANLQLATQAFDGIIDNIAARGSHLFDYEELGEESLDFSGTMLSEADVSLLESLLSYFKQLGEQNDTDLSSETAAAHKRVGDIQQRIGKLEESEKSYTTSLDLYRSLSKREESTLDSESIQNRESGIRLQQQIAIYIELLLVQSQQGKIWMAWESYNDCRNLIESDRAFSSSQEGRFQKAKLLNCVGRISSQMQARPIRGERSPALNPRDSKGNVNRSRWMEFAGLPLAARLRKEAELNREAIDLLTSLVAETSDKAAYRSALAQALRDESRLAMLRNDKEESEKSLVRAVELLNELIHQYPDNSSYRYQLAETLWASTSRPMGRPPGSQNGNNDAIPFATKDTDRLEQALKICNELLQEQPLEPAYLALKGTVLSRLGQTGGLIGRSRAVEYLYESVRLYTGLSDRFPELPMYRAQRIESLLKLSRIEPNRSKAVDYYDQAIAEADKLGNSRLRNQIGPLIERMRERRQSLENNKP